ncbi:MAG TPA: hypothetical protein VJN64_09785 [Terriglobales bacterium]|nr:hypothetical protein [Terriglobales bacterium]
MFIPVQIEFFAVRLQAQAWNPTRMKRKKIVAAPAWTISKPTAQIVALKLWEEKDAQLRLGLEDGSRAEAGGSRPFICGHSRAQSPDRRQGAAQNTASIKVEKIEVE